VSKLTDHIRRTYSTPSYSADFEVSRKFPVHLVHCFGQIVMGTVAGVEHRQQHRFVKASRTAESVALRQQLYRTLKWMRRLGLTADDVRRMACSVIDAPESYAGTVRAGRWETARMELRTRFALSLSTVA
jgi:hypothetical protein